ncbi:uncharacterized protein LDX57_006985 [Aspergillus melleus]|uniref:uncharacterized protein n=1 Tax=Aspergillus melleus TaxID=138277 RepID=UPI001E8CD15C|nr:uncharacterized protein LDX57_006985 [Aspergillus melleus]KAH8429318.1 hypothetical protein LDX57_006985 [Aspergillus melleus]
MQLLPAILLLVSPLALGLSPLSFLQSLGSNSLPAQDNAQRVLNTEHQTPKPSWEHHTLPTWYTSTLQARRLLQKSSVGRISTTFPSPIIPDPVHHYNPPGMVSGLPITLPEYVASCHPDGNPTILGLHLGTTFKNAAFGSNVSLSLDWWDHIASDTDVPLRDLSDSRMALPRAVLIGYLEPYPSPVDPETRVGLERCFLDAHPDARAWLPGREGAAHAGFWARMVVRQVFWVGGFGDRALIGWVNMTEWEGIREDGSEPGVGDGRGWKDALLPGE